MREGDSGGFWAPVFLEDFLHDAILVGSSGNSEPDMRRNSSAPPKRIVRQGALRYYLTF